MSLDRERLQAVFLPEDHIEVHADSRTLVFLLTDRTPPTQVWWRVSDRDLASLIVKLSPGARAAYGIGGDGFSVLVTLLLEQLMTFQGER
jgi:hypothetical protein